MIRSFFARLRRMARDIYLHLGPGMLCQLRGRHRDLHEVGRVSKRGGFRPVPLLQCSKCFAFYIPDAYVKRLGGRDA